MLRSTWIFEVDRDVELVWLDVVVALQQHVPVALGGILPLLLGGVWARVRHAGVTGESESMCARCVKWAPFALGEVAFTNMVFTHLCDPQNSTHPLETFHHFPLAARKGAHLILEPHSS